MAPTRAQSRGLISRLIGLISKLFLLLVVVTIVAWLATRPATPDAFYSYPLPLDVAAGTLLKSEPFTKAIPTGAKGWRILYTTTRGGRTALASAVVVTPEHFSVDLRVIAWAHGTTGVADGCAPSVLDKPFDNVPDLSAILREGWAYVGTDYPGLGTGGGHTYLVGADAARACSMPSGPRGSCRPPISAIVSSSGGIHKAETPPCGLECVRSNSHQN